MGNYIPGGVRGLLLPRNHDGNGSTTKAGILDRTLITLSDITDLTLDSCPLFAIEDAQHHAKGYVNHPRDIEVFMPSYPWNETLENTTSITRVEQTYGTVDTFLALHEQLLVRGIVK